MGESRPGSQRTAPERQVQAVVLTPRHLAGTTWVQVLPWVGTWVEQVTGLGHRSGSQGAAQGPKEQQQKLREGSLCLCHFPKQDHAQAPVSSMSPGPAAPASASPRVCVPGLRLRWESWEELAEWTVLQFETHMFTVKEGGGCKRLSTEFGLCLEAES